MLCCCPYSSPELLAAEPGAPDQISWLPSLHHAVSANGKRGRTGSPARRGVANAPADVAQIGAIFFYFFLFFFTVPLKSDFAATNKQHLVCGLG